MRICSISDCSRKHVAKDLCGYHYAIRNKASEQSRRLYARVYMAKKAKNPVTIEHVTERVIERLMNKVDKTDDCWNWTGAKTANRKNSKGYGYINVNGRPFYVHRLSFLIANGSLTEGLVIDHLCNNTLCINPEHLAEVTNKHNSTRSPKHSSNVPGGYNARSICKYGHPREAGSYKPCPTCYPKGTNKRVVA